MHGAEAYHRHVPGPLCLGPRVRVRVKGKGYTERLGHNRTEIHRAGPLDSPHFQGS